MPVPCQFGNIVDFPAKGPVLESSMTMDDTSNPNDEVPGPYRIKLDSRKRYLWCACGRSRKQPLCDASHEGSRFEPVSYQAAEDITVAFCGCKLTRTPPFCDGTHVHVTRNADGLLVRKDDC